MSSLNSIDHLKISLLSPEKVLEQSYGEVTKPETINYKTLRAEPDGLFSERIFGPMKRGECAAHCGQYKRQKLKGKFCPKCGVEITDPNVRRERMGHIALASPVAHFWYFRSQQKSYISNLLGIPSKKLESVIYCRLYIVIDPMDTPLEKMQLLTTKEYLQALKTYGHAFEIGTGAEAIKKLLVAIDIEKTYQELKEALRTEKTQKRENMIKRLKLIQAFRKSGNKPEWMIVENLPVLPPNLRPMVQLDGGRFATSDLNDLYRRVLNRNKRLKRLIELGAPPLIIENEKRLLQDAVDSLFANQRKKNKMMGTGKRELKSLSSALEGKKGIFRQNLLGKRVDYSGRAVIIAGPELKLHQFGIPREMALELFKPHVMRQLKEQGYVSNVKKSRAKIERRDEEVWDILEEIVKNYLLLLNRAPTLHKLSIRAFEPVIVEGKAIQLHPLVCPAFNADFDGDQMAVHLPLSIEAQAESRVLMLANKNLLHPQNGKSAVSPSQDMVIGCHYLSIERKNAKGEGKIFTEIKEALRAYETGVIDMHAKIVVRVENEEKLKEGKYLVTTAGKLIFNQNLPQGIPYINNAAIQEKPEGLFQKAKEAVEYLPEKDNNPIGKEFLEELVGYAYDEIGQELTAEMLDEIKYLGFHYATRAGITISLSDIVNPPNKEKYIQEAIEKRQEVIKTYELGRISDEERYLQIIKIWREATDKVGEDAIEALYKDDLNPLKMMLQSRARGSKGQIRQLDGMRGLMADPSGRVIERPIIANFKEGLDPYDYFISTHGSRKGMADTALRTADAGYLTRKMVDAAQDVIITMDDCGTNDYTIFKGMEEIELKLQDRIVGRLLGRDVYDENRKLIGKKGQLVTKELAKTLVEKFDSVPIRSVFDCQARRGVCQKCYGLDLATRKVVAKGEAVGVIAAQSIGEPGTQLTMRTFHSGGVADGDITQGLPRVIEIVEARKIIKAAAILSEIDGYVQIVEKGREREIVITSDEGEEKKYKVAHRQLLVTNGQRIKRGDRLINGSINPHELLLLKGIRETQKYLLDEIQKVYCEQGVSINDKHIEIIVRQMGRKVVIKNPGDSNLLLGSIADRYRVKEINLKLKKEGKKEIITNDLLKGITDASRSSESFLSAASFQETSSALTAAAIVGKKDHLYGLKESVIVGKRIPAGTGFSKYLD